MASDRTLRWTPLRHRMLVKVQSGEVKKGLDPQRRWLVGDIPSDYGRCERAVRALVSAGLARRVTSVDGPDWTDPYVLTDSGVATLRQWTAKHGEPT